MEETQKDWRSTVLELEIQRPYCSITAAILAESQLKRACSIRDEKAISYILSKNLNALSGGRFRCLARECIQIYYPEKGQGGIYGKPDLIVWDAELSSIVIVEIKVTGSSHSAILQLVDYVWAFQDRRIEGGSPQLQQILCNSQIPYYGLLISSKHSLNLHREFQKLKDWEIGYLSYFKLDTLPLATQALNTLASELRRETDVANK